MFAWIFVMFIKICRIHLNYQIFDFNCNTNEQINDQVCKTTFWPYFYVCLELYLTYVDVEVTSTQILESRSNILSCLHNRKFLIDSNIKKKKKI